MSLNKRRGGVALFSSPAPEAEADSDSSDDAPIPQRIQKRPRATRSSESSGVSSDSERDYYSDSSEESSESDHSLEVRFNCSLSQRLIQLFEPLFFFVFAFS